MRPVRTWGTKTDPARSASVNPKTKNWLGLESMTPPKSLTKSLSLAIQRVWVVTPLTCTSGAEGGAFDLGGDGEGGEAVGGEDGDEVEEQGLGHFVGCCGESVHVADFGGSGEIDFEELLDLGLGADGVGEALAIALVDEELVVVEGYDVTDAGASGEAVGVLVGGAGGDVDGGRCGGGWLLPHPGWRPECREPE